MYYTNKFDQGVQYSKTESFVYKGLESAVASSYTGRGHSDTDKPYHTSSLKQDYEPNKPAKEQVDVVFVREDSFELFLKYSPLLRSLESEQVEKLYKEYLKGEGKHLLKFLKDKGRRFIDLVGFARMQLDKNAIAAVIRTGERAILAVNLNFDEMIYDFAKHNNISINDALLYVFSHETVHLADELSEKRTETMVGDFFTEFGEDKLVDKPRFEQLKSVAYRRAEEVSN